MSVKFNLNELIKFDLNIPVGMNNSLRKVNIGNQLLFIEGRMESVGNIPVFSLNKKK